MESTTLSSGYDGAPDMSRDLVPRPPLLDCPFALADIVSQGSIAASAGSPQRTDFSERIHTEKHGLLVASVSRRIGVAIALETRDNLSMKPNGRVKRTKPDLDYIRSVARRLREIRESLKDPAGEMMSQPKMAESIGAERSQYGKWEQDNAKHPRPITLFFLVALCRRWEIDPWYVLTGEQKFPKQVFETDISKKLHEIGEGVKKLHVKGAPDPDRLKQVLEVLQSILPNRRKDRRVRLLSLFIPRPEGPSTLDDAVKVICELYDQISADEKAEDTARRIIARLIGARNEQG